MCITNATFWLSLIALKPCPRYKMFLFVCIGERMWVMGHEQHLKSYLLWSTLLGIWMRIFAIDAPDFGQLLGSNSAFQNSFISINTEWKRTYCAEGNTQNRVKFLPSVRNSYIAVIQMCGLQNQPHCQQESQTEVWKLKAADDSSFLSNCRIIAFGKIAFKCVNKDRKPHTM